jgi:mannose-6-phosphate isomerase-like protein (cupin superfamily)
MMSAVFELNHEKLRGDPRFCAIANELSKLSRIDSAETFNRYCQVACRIWSEQFRDGPIGQTSAHFVELLGRIQRGGEGIIQTSWGGVVVKMHKHPRVEKYLVIRQGGYLALERHEEKDERLEVKEGAGLILWRSASDEPLTVAALTRGDKFHFPPGMEHCLIGTENLLVFERSTDPKGMDQDLIFIYTPEVAPLGGAQRTMQQP